MSGHLSLSYSKVNQQSNKPPIQSSLSSQIEQHSTPIEFEMTTTNNPQNLQNEDITTHIDEDNKEELNNHDTKYNQQQDRNIARLNEDVWALAYIIAKTRSRLPYPYICLLIFIFFVQFGTLFAMVYSFYCSIVYDVVKEVYFSSIRCVDAHTDDAPDMNTRWTSVKEDYNFTVYSPQSCYYSQLIEYDPEFQRYYDKDIATEPDGRYSLDSWQAVQTDVMWVFLFCQLTSFSVLIIYIISSMVNPVVMLTIGYQKVN